MGTRWFWPSVLLAGVLSGCGGGGQAVRTDNLARPIDVPPGTFREVERITLGGDIEIVTPAGQGVDVVWFAEDTLHTVRVEPNAQPRERSAAPFRDRDPYEGVTWMGSAAGADWGVDHDDDLRLVRIDGPSGKVLARYDVNVAFEQIVAGDGAVWLASRADGGIQGGLYRVDPNSTKVERAAVGAVAGVAVSEDAVWATVVADEQVVRVDPVSLHVLARIPVEGPPDDVEVGGDTVWVTNFDDAGMQSSVHRIDVTANRLIDTKEMGDPSGAYELVADAHASSRALWALLQADEGGAALVRVDGETGAVARHAVPKSGRTFAINGGDLWLAAGRTLIHYRAG